MNKRGGIGINLPDDSGDKGVDDALCCEIGLDDIWLSLVLFCFCCVIG